MELTINILHEATCFFFFLYTSGTFRRLSVAFAVNGRRSCVAFRYKIVRFSAFGLGTALVHNAYQIFTVVESNDFMCFLRHGGSCYVYMNGHLSINPPRQA